MSDNLERVTLVTPEAVAEVGHDEAMIALVDKKAAENTASTRPSWLPAKFATPEAMAASYAALEAKQSGGKQAAPVDAVPEGDDDNGDLTIDKAPETAAEVVKEAGLDMASLNTEFANTGKLSEDSYKKLAAVGFDKAAVDNYVAGQQALVSNFETEVKSATPGGADKFNDMIAWAKVNMTESQINAFNAAVGSGNKDQAKMAVAGLGTSYIAAVGREPVLQGGRTNGASADVFESLAQMKVAMSDKRYKTDHAYRASIQAKLGRSNIM